MTGADAIIGESQILDTLPDGFQAFDRQWRYTFLNRRAEVILGRSRQELIGQVCWEVYPEVCGTSFHAAYLSAMEAGTPTSFEFYCPHERRWVEFSLHPHPDGLFAWQRDVTDRHREHDRAVKLQEITAALSESLTPAQVMSVVVDGAVRALEARTGAAALLSSDGTCLELMRAVGLSERNLAGWQRFPVDAPLPLSDVVRAGQARYWQNLSALAEEYPALASVIQDGDDSAAGLPLRARGRVIGGLYLSFPGVHEFSEEEKRFLELLARQCAQALERARLYEETEQARHAAEMASWETDRARQRMAFLAEASAELASSLDLNRTLERMAHIVVPRLADWCAVMMPDVAEGTLRHFAVAHVNPERVLWARELGRRYATRLDEPEGAARVFRTGESSYLPEIQDALLVAAAKDETHLRLLRELAFRSAITVALNARGRTLGVLLLATTSESERPLEPDDLAFAEELARRAAVAVDNARLFQEAEDELVHRRRAEALVKTRAIQQKAVARLGMAALSGAPVASVMNEASTLVTEALDVEICEVLEMLPSGDALRLVAGIGWNDGQVGTVTVGAGSHSQAGYTLLSSEPVVVQDLRRETRFHPPSLLREHGVVSGMTCIIRGRGRHWGVLGAFTRKQRTFTGDDTHFLQAIANVLATAIERRQVEEERRAFLRDVLASVTEGRLLLCEGSAGLPEPCEPFGGPIQLSREVLRAVRRRASDAARRVGFDRARIHDLQTAATEAAANALRHGGGGVVQVRIDRATSTVQIWIEDTGRGIDLTRLPQATLERGYTSNDGFGHGFWLMLRTCDRTYLRTGPSGTTVVLEQDRIPVEPSWLNGT